MEYIAVGKIAQRFARQLLKSRDCLKSQTLNITTTLGRCDDERDNNKFTLYEGHTVNEIYQASCARRAFSTLTTTAAATDRPVYPHFVYGKNHSTNQQPFTRHTRFYCTAKPIRKKMVRFFFLIIKCLF